MGRALSTWMVLGLLGCTGSSHTSDRPTVMDCDTAVTAGLQRDPCALDVECGIESGALTLRSAVCDNGTLLTSLITYEQRPATGACAGAPVSGAPFTAEFSFSERGCVDVEVCEESVGQIRDAHVCQIGSTLDVGDGAAWDDCAVAVDMGQDGDPCMGAFACIEDRSIGPAGVLSILGWCDAGILRLAPSQTLLFGAPGG